MVGRRLTALVLVIAAGVCAFRAADEVRAPSPAGGVTFASDPTPLDAQVEVLLRYDDRRGVWVEPVRWERRRVRFRFTDAVDAAVADEMRAAFAWAEGPTGLQIVEVTSGPAEIVVDAASHNGGRTVWIGQPGVLERVAVTVGCCRPAVVWHEALHALGLSHAEGPGHTMSAAGPVLPVGVLERRALEVLYGASS